ncbi:MAG: sulfite reductase subunit alpha [Candidatus Andeanibacterium colombiense]|uniref:NADPH--hemoprotein reductase n=1 Tax=Candidatus Andeanibacterium colombiense TaxID=3121345 RepID=A0AAJ5X2M9_9SPHN|nr:MAG: sulfite reductase subunit alpha [Sphingomonadaceae bacterium]
MSETARLLIAAAASGAWLTLTGATAWHHRARRAAPLARGTVLVAYASQTGTAAAYAKATANALEASGRQVALTSFARLTPAMLADTDEALFLAATTGEGDPPDDAAGFLRKFSAAPLRLESLRYALLALGDSHYRDFCGFGRALDRLLRDAGAVHAADPVEVDQADPGALRHWQQNLRLFGAAVTLPDWEAPRYSEWKLAERELLNPGSPGGAMFRIRLEPAGELPAWEAGDIAEIYPGLAAEALSAAPALPHRDYSLATIPAEGGAGLVVRLFKDEQGRSGLGSGWLCEDAAPGAAVALRIRSNPRFHTPEAATPLILIGNGTGISSLRGHLVARGGGTRNWLIFGERDPLHDRPFAAELDAWLHDRHLARLQRVFSRAGTGQRYVQHALAAEADLLREWVAAGAVVMVCGSVAMGEAVDEALREALGAGPLDALQDEGRYRRDIY